VGPIPTILQIIPDLETGGAEQTTLDVARAIVDQGWNAVVASAGGRLQADIEDAGGAHVTLPLRAKNPAALLVNAQRLAHLIRGRNVDVVHARSRAPAWSALLAAKQTNRPLVTTYHGAYRQSGPLKGFYNSVMARGDVVIANSAYTADMIRARHPIAKERITVVHRGTDFSAFDPAALTEDRRDRLRQAWGVTASTPILLQVARLTEWKGQSVVIEAMGKLGSGHGDIVAVLAGDAQGRQQYIEQLLANIRSLSLDGRVRLVGHCDDVPAALSLADVSVVASTQPEAFGRAAVEAQAMGVPVIVSDLGAVGETVLAPPQIDDLARTGWRVPAGDAEALAGAVEAVLAMPAGDRTKLTARAGDHVRALFSVQAMTEATLNVYRALLNSHDREKK